MLVSRTEVEIGKVNVTPAPSIPNLILKII